MTTRTTLNVWVSDLTFPGYMDRWAKLAAAFERAHPECEVRIRGLGFFTGPAELAEAIAEGNPPAIAEYYFYMAPVARDTFGCDGALQYTSVEQAIGGRAEILGEPVVTGDIIPAMREQYTYRGDLTSLPSIGTTSLLYANTKLLEAAGLSRMPETWDEVEAACETIGRPAITWANHGMWYQQAIASQGGLLCDRDNGRSGRATTVNLASEQMLAWANWWRGLHRSGYYAYTGKIPDWEGNFRLFAEQQVALRISSSNDVNYMAQAAKAGGFGVEAGRFPYDSRVPYAGNTIAGTSLWLSAGLDEATRDHALAFLMFAHNPRNAAERHKATSFLPVTQASYDLLASEGWFDEHPYHKAACDQLATYPAASGAQGAPPCRGALFGDFAGNQDVMTRAMGDVLLEGADPAERFTEATAEAQRLLDDYNLDAAGTGPRRPESLRVEYFRDVEAYSGADLENVVQLNG
jgi:sn-glycerol 3-phosphate transport system substrate-binding protein